MRKTIRVVPALMILLGWVQSLWASEFYTLDCIADAPMYGYSTEADLNYGTRQHMRIKDYQGIPFLQFEFHLDYHGPLA